MNNFPNINAFPTLSELAEEFRGAEVFLVGGAVRDCILNKKLTDIDLVVKGVGGEELEEFLAQHGRVLFAGRHFGVWKFNEIGKPRDEVYDIALPRTEFSMHKQGIYKDFDIKTNPRLPIEEDLKRRDFTINAIAYNLVTEQIIDPQNGQKDVQEKIIRSVGNPVHRFQEDYSRMLRALRFSIQLKFNIEKNTQSTIKKMIPNINNEIEGKRAVPMEIISEEFLKSMEINPVASLDLWDEFGAISEIIPELIEMKGCPQPPNWHKEGDVREHTRLALEKLYSSEFKQNFGDKAPSIELIIAVLFHDIGKPYTLETPKQNEVDRIRFNEHDIVGSRITKTVLDRIKAQAPPDTGIDSAKISWLVRYHMLLVHGNPSDMKPSTIEKYFFNPNKPSQNLLKLILADGLATKGPQGKGLTGKFYELCEKISEIKKITKSHGTKLAKPLINGNDVMSRLNIKPSEKVGQILEDVRQKQLNGEITSREKALEYLKTYAN